jgi:hypothetical protein
MLKERNEQYPLESRAVLMLYKDYFWNMGCIDSINSTTTLDNVLNNAKRNPYMYAILSTQGQRAVFSEVATEVIDGSTKKFSVQDNVARVKEILGPDRPNIEEVGDEAYNPNHNVHTLLLREAVQGMMSYDVPAGNPEKPEDMTRIPQHIAEAYIHLLYLIALDPEYKIPDFDHNNNLDIQNIPLNSQAQIVLAQLSHAGREYTRNYWSSENIAKRFTEYQLRQQVQLDKFPLLKTLRPPKSPKLESPPTTQTS